jgi:gamma-glutamylputrescine oxidase
MARRSLPPSYFRLAAPDVPQFPKLDGSRRADVCVVGGGFTGLSAALHLAEAGVDVVLIEADTVASGASGRSGGQIHSGQRRDVLWLEQHFGFERAKRLWDSAEEAKALLRALIIRYAISCDLKPGVIEALHKASLLSEAAQLVEALTGRYNYDRVSLFGAEETANALGSERFAGAVYDRGGGHLDPYRFAIGLAKAAANLGAAIHEGTPALALTRDGVPVVRTASGEVRAEHVIVATDGRSNGFERITRHRMVGINSFVVVTEPLGSAGDAILPGGESSADSRFVVRYWRKTGDGRLVFGGGESNVGRVPPDVSALVRPHMLEIYPQLGEVAITHGWGGVVSVTVPRLPYVREIAPAVWAAGGYSGQGVALAPYLGMLLAEAVRGGTDRLSAFSEIPIPWLPGTTWIRRLMVTLAIWQGRFGDRL